MDCSTLFWGIKHLAIAQKSEFILTNNLKLINHPILSSILPQKYIKIFEVNESLIIVRHLHSC